MSDLRELLIISEHFAPSTGATAQLITDLAQALVDRGHRCRVLTATAGPASFPFPVRRFVVPLGREGSAGVLGKALRGAAFLVGTLTWCLIKAQPEQRILIASNPPFIGLLGPLLRWLRGVEYVFLFQDLFPRSAALTGVLPAAGPVTGLWRALMSLVTSKSLATVVLSEAMARRLQRDNHRRLPVVVIHNWAVEQALPLPKNANPLAREWGVDEAFTVQYSGNFGRLHDLLTLLEAARLLQLEPINFLFIGAGAKHYQLTAYQEAFHLERLQVHPYQPRERLPLSLGACDLAAIGLIPGAEDTVAPSKFYGILASGKGVLLIAQRRCDLAQLVLRERCGLVVEPGDVVELAAQLLELSRNPDQVAMMGASARRLYTEKFGIERSVRAYESLLSEHA